MEQDPLVSIIIPVYKVEKFLDECVASVAAQTYANLEILLVDDGSPDNCPAMCDAWAARDPRIRVIHKPNGGLSDARNSGIAEAIGAYIYFADSDDTVAPTLVEDCLNAMREYDADLVMFQFDTISESNKPLLSNYRGVIHANGGLSNAHQRRHAGTYTSPIDDPYGPVLVEASCANDADLVMSRTPSPRLFNYRRLRGGPRPPSKSKSRLRLTAISGPSWHPPPPIRAPDSPSRWVAKSRISPVSAT